jgi:hypothetical protein
VSGWYLVITMDHPYTGIEHNMPQAQLSTSEIRIPFSTEKSARRAASTLHLAVERAQPETLQGKVEPNDQEAQYEAPAESEQVQGAAADPGPEGRTPPGRR